jgi:hypothetical protein
MRPDDIAAGVLGIPADVVAGPGELDYVWPFVRDLGLE